MRALARRAILLPARRHERLVSALVQHVGADHGCGGSWRIPIESIAAGAEHTGHRRELDAHPGKEHFPIDVPIGSLAGWLVGHPRCVEKVDSIPFPAWRIFAKVEILPRTK